MTRQFDLLVVGDANPDVVLSGVPRMPPFGQRERLVNSGALTLGGSAAITACGAARLGLRTAFVGRVGDDALGRFALDALTQRGVDVSGCTIDPAAATALTVILIDGADRAILTAPGCLPLLTVEDIDPDLAGATAHVHVSSFFLQPRLAAGLPRWFAAVRDAGTTTSLDTNDDPAGTWDGGVAATIGQTDVLLPNENEALALAGELHRAGPGRDGAQLGGGYDAVTSAAQRLATMTGLPVIKRGARGAVAWYEGGAVAVPGLAADPVDTVGAGDSFNAGFLAGWLRGRPIEESLRLAAACGALSTRAAGGTAAQPTMAEALTALTAAAAVMPS